MPKLKYKDGSTWKEFSLSISGGGATKINVIASPSATVTYSNSSGTDKGSIKVNSSGLGSLLGQTNDEYTFTDSTSKITITENITSLYEVNLLGATYQLKIDTSNSDPEKAITYIGDIAGHATGWDAWKNEPLFKDIKPCVLKDDGTVNYYLNKDNFTLKESGGSSVLTGTDGDVMVEIPNMGYKFETSGNIVTLSLTTIPKQSGYCYLAHSLNKENDCSYIYAPTYI